MATRMSIAAADKPAKPTHDARQQAIVAVAEDIGPDTMRFALASPDGHALAPFEPGSFVPVFVEHDGRQIAQSYAIASAPRDARRGIYQIVVRRAAGGFASSCILDTWHVGSRVTMGTPAGNDAFRQLEAGGEVVALAGGAGIAPFLSFARAIADGDANFRLTLFYAASESSGLLFPQEWPRIESLSDGKVKVVPVIAGVGDDAEGCERGPITRALIERHADPARATFLICAPGPMVAALRKELSPWNLARNRLRFWFSGDAEFDHVGTSSFEHRVTVRMGGETFTVPAREDETILTAIEKAGLQPAAYCRCGICGFCESMLVSGIFVLATDEHGERHIRERNSHIHPCCSYPRSDMEMVVPRART